jgi:hypothetical protein
MRWVRRLVPLILLLVLVPASKALAQSGGGMPAPDFSEPCPATYPGDDAEKARIARWMARGAADRGLPLELPVMAGLTESGLENVRGSGFSGFFGMSRALNTGDYRGFPRDPELQLRWFTDTAMLVRQRRVAEGRDDPAGDAADYGSWIADVERPARQYRSRYQTHLDESRELIAGKCDPPSADDTAGPRLRVRLATTQRPLTTGGIAVDARCPDNDCLVGAMVESGDVVRRAAALEPAPKGYTRLIVRVPRSVRKRVRQGGAASVRVTVIAADTAANPTSRTRLVALRH